MTGTQELSRPFCAWCVTTRHDRAKARGHFLRPEIIVRERPNSKLLCNAMLYSDFYLAGGFYLSIYKCHLLYVAGVSPPLHQLSSQPLKLETLHYMYVLSSPVTKHVSKAIIFFSNCISYATVGLKAE